MKRIVTTAAALAVLAGSAHVPSASAAEAKLKAASFLPGRSIFAKFFYDWVKETNKQCAGKVHISVVGPSAIASLEQWHALKDGVVDMDYGPTTYMRGALPAGDVLDLAENTPAEQRKNGARKLLVAYFKAHVNAMYLTHILNGVHFYLYTTKPAVNGRFDGFRLRSVPVYDDFFRSLGATTQRMGAPSVYTALQRGVIDGYGWPLWGISDFGWQKFTKYRYGPGFFNASTPIIMNLDRWNKLDKAQRGCIRGMALWLEKQWPKWRAGEDQRQIAIQNKAGIKYVDLGPGFAKKARDLYWAALEKADPKFVNKIKPLLMK